MVNLRSLRLWEQGLRSGEFEQGDGHLNRDGKYCCLGVACVMAMRDGVELTVDQHRGVVAYDSEESELPEKVVAWLGVDYHDPVIGEDEFGFVIEAIHANDDLVWTFDKIADSIRDYYHLGADDNA